MKTLPLGPLCMLLASAALAADGPPAEKATGAAVVICPGGGHRELGFEPEGREAGEYFASIGVA
jgi:hypothetical protein